MDPGSDAVPNRIASSGKTWSTRRAVLVAGVSSLAAGVIAAWFLGWSMSGKVWWIRSKAVTGNGGLFDVVRATITLLGVVGIAIGGALAYRKQHLGEQQYEQAQRQLELAHRQFELSQEQHEDQRESDRRDFLRGEVSRRRDRFATAASQLGDDNLSVRLAGVHAMAGLADEWLDQKPEASDDSPSMEAQVCVDVLCAYLRVDAESTFGQAPPDRDATDRPWDIEVRQTIVRVIAAHKRGEDPDWAGMHLDFTGARFSGDFSFDECNFSSGMVDFSNASITAGVMSFREAGFTGGTVAFSEGAFSGGRITFDEATFSRGKVLFDRVRFTGTTVSFVAANLKGGGVHFAHATFSNGLVDFSTADFDGTSLRFTGASLCVGGSIDFGMATISDGEIVFSTDSFVGGTVHFASARIADSRLVYGPWPSGAVPELWPPSGASASSTTSKSEQTSAETDPECSPDR